jgi:LPXTG-motif cell wall-anchored protein
MNDLLEFLVGVSPILLIMFGTLGAGLYVLIRRRKHHH